MATVAPPDSPLARTLPDEPEDGVIEEARRRQRRRRLTLAAFSAAAAVTALALLLALDRGGSAPRLPPVPASAGGQPALRLRPGQYFYVLSRQANAEVSGRYAVLVLQRREIWFGWDGSGRLRQTFGAPIFLSAADRANWEAAGRPALRPPGTSDIAFGRGCLTMRNLAVLPTDPNQLRAQLVARKTEGGPPGAGEDFVQIGDLLRETNTSSALRYALYEVARSLPGVRFLPSVTDHAGRAGIGLLSVDRGLENDLIIDANTKTLLGEQTTIASAKSGFNAPSGTVINWASYVHSGVVDGVPRQRPTTRIMPLPARASESSSLPRPIRNSSATPAVLCGGK